MTTTTGFVQYSTPINIIHDPLDVIASKKQFVKRQAFALLNTELDDDTTYVIRTSCKWIASVPPVVLPGEPFGIGIGTYTYRITYRQWSNEQ